MRPLLPDGCRLYKHRVEQTWVCTPEWLDKTMVRSWHKHGGQKKAFLVLLREAWKQYGLKFGIPDEDLLFQQPVDDTDDPVAQGEEGGSASGCGAAAASSTG